jgi:hypothetical protein
MPAFDFSPWRNTQRGLWLGDFRLENGRILVKSTGDWINNDLQVWRDTGRWLTYYAFVRWHGFWVRLTRRPGVRLSAVK